MKPQHDIFATTEIVEERNFCSCDTSNSLCPDPNQLLSKHQGLRPPLDRGPYDPTKDFFEVKVIHKGLKSRLVAFKVLPVAAQFSGLTDGDDSVEHHDPRCEQLCDLPYAL